MLNERRRMTPQGALGFDPSALAAALNLSRDARNREAAPASGPSFPRVRVVGGQWCRQNVDEGAWWPIPLPELRELLGLEAA